MYRLTPTTFCILFLTLATALYAQETAPPPEREAIVYYRQQGAALQFGAELPPHIQIPGAPPAYYEYYWEFGDGSFSFEEEPLHIYPEAGAYDVQLWATGKYDNGKSPKSRGKKAEVRRDTARAMASLESAPHVLPEENASLGMRAVRNPRPGEEFVAILSYRNPEAQFNAGQLYLFFNESKYPKPHFDYVEARTHHGEYETEPAGFSWRPGIVGPGSWAGVATSPEAWLPTPSPPKYDPRVWLAGARAEFQTQKTWRFENMEPGAVRNLFFSLNPTEHMAADTNVTLHLRAVYVPDAGGAADIYDLSIPIVASHDPNFIAVSDRRIGFRNIQRKKLSYEVHFQNNGKGPAKRIQITTTIPKGLDIEALEVLGNHPACPICPKTPVEYGCMDTTIQKEKILFTFYNIYLPGTKQDGVSDRDSTKGFVRYRIVPSRKIKKLPFRSRASIVFDRNKPVITNFSKTRFKMGISPGPLLGYRFLPGAGDRGAFVAGLVAAPYKPYRPYFQIELLTGFTGEWEERSDLPRDTIRTEAEVDGPNGFPILVQTDSIFQAKATVTRRLQTFQLVPLQLRYNLNAFLSLGAGTSVTVIREQWERTFDESYQVTEFWCFEPGAPCEPMAERSDSNQGTDSGASTRLRLGFFADLQVGKVRAGPVAGIRPTLHLGEEDPFSLLVYLSYKF